VVLLATSGGKVVEAFFYGRKKKINAYGRKNDNAVLDERIDKITRDRQHSSEGLAHLPLKREGRQEESISDAK